MFSFFYLLGCSGTEFTITGATYWPIKSVLHDCDCGAIDGINDWQGNPEYSEKTAPVALCPPQIPHDPCWNPDRRCDEPATSRLRYGSTMFLNKRVSFSDAKLIDN
jgi:hypothetical protein